MQISLSLCDWINMYIPCHNTQNTTYRNYMIDYRIKSLKKQNVSILTTDPLRNKVADRVYIEGWMKVKCKFHIYLWSIEYTCP
jgi:hypothetical protein